MAGSARRRAAAAAGQLSDAALDPAASRRRRSQHLPTLPCARAAGARAACPTHQFLLLALLALLAGVTPTPANAHGTLLQPRSRNFLAYLRGKEYYAHGLAAGGIVAMSDAGALQWPAMRLDGLCGGAPGNDHWEQPGEVTATYGQGATVTVDAVVTVNHLGRVRVRVCPLKAKRMDGGDGCVDLDRADGKGKWWYLPFVQGWSGGTAGTNPPLYGDGYYEAYTLPAITPKEGCESGQRCDAYLGQTVYRTKWRLPPNLECEHCKLVYEWMTAHSCWPPCPSELENEPTCENRQVYPQCGAPGTQYPEYFFNCADVKISAAARSDGGSPRWTTEQGKKGAEAWGSPVVVKLGQKPEPFRTSSGKPAFAPGPPSGKSATTTASGAAAPAPATGGGAINQLSGPAPPPPADSPTCYKTSQLQSRADPRPGVSTRWGFEDGKACIWRGEPNNKAALASRQAADAEAAKAPACKTTPESKTTVDDEGRRWGFEAGRSCLFSLAPPLSAVAAGGAAAASSPPPAPPGKRNVRVCRSTPLSKASPDIDGTLWGFEDGEECVYVKGKSEPGAAVGSGSTTTTTTVAAPARSPSPSPSPKPVVLTLAKAPVATKKEEEEEDAKPAAAAATKAPSPSPSPSPSLLNKIVDEKEKLATVAFKPFTASSANKAASAPAAKKEEEDEEEEAVDDAEEEADEAAAADDDDNGKAPPPPSPSPRPPSPSPSPRAPAPSPSPSPKP
jgi:hypothetical protein